MLGTMTALAFVLQVYKFLSKRNTFRMVTGVPARLWSTATAPHRVRRCRRTRGNRKIFVIWPPSPVCAFPTKLKVRIWGGGKGRRKERERERGCLPRPVLLPYYTQGNNNYTCRNNKAIIIIVAILHSSRSLIVICFRIMPAQCRRQCQSLNSMLFHNPLISQNLVPINSSTKTDQPSDNQIFLVKLPT